MQRIIFLMLALTGFILSCKNDNNNEQISGNNRTINEDSLIRSGYTRILSEEETDEQIQSWRLNADAVIKYRSKEDNRKTWSVLTSGVWEEEFIFEIGMDNPQGNRMGNWIQYLDDLTYKYGYYEEEKGKGVYHYNPDTKLLIMLDNDSKKAPKEYEAQIINDWMVWSGQMTYKNNGTQMKLVKLKERPKRD